MKALVFASLMILSWSVVATVVEMDDRSANRVIDVYEEMREEQVEAPDNGWIHDFEKDAVGSEMDHLSDAEDEITKKN